jgi:hypothetical protein
MSAQRKVRVIVTKEREAQIVGLFNLGMDAAAIAQQTSLSKSSIRRVKQRNAAAISHPTKRSVTPSNPIAPKTELPSFLVAPQTTFQIGAVTINVPDTSLDKMVKAIIEAQK